MDDDLARRAFHAQALLESPRQLPPTAIAAPKHAGERGSVASTPTPVHVPVSVGEEGRASTRSPVPRNSVAVPK